KHIYKKKEETPPTPTPSIPSIPDQPSKPIENNTTIWVDENGNQLKDPKNGSVEKGKDPEGYEFVGTVKTKDGDTAHVYKKIAKEAGKVEEKETPKEKETQKRKKLQKKLLKQKLIKKRIRQKQVLIKKQIRQKQVLIKTPTLMLRQV
ncbi:hypothetical protein, partial [Anaerococcus tetradius]